MLKDGIEAPVIVITPVYEDVEASRCFFAELRRHVGPDAYVVAVDDGSVREPLPIGNLEDAGLAGVVLRLNRNVGHQRAIAIGLGYVSDRMRDDARVLIMDSDGEDDPASAGLMLSRLSDPSVDVVVAERKRRAESMAFRISYLAYRAIFRLLTGRRIRFGNFMAMGAKAVQRLTAMQETWVHVAASVLASKLRIASQALDRTPRYAGKSKMSFVGLALHGFRAVMVFAEDVLVRVGIACTLIAALSVLGVAIAIMLKIIGYATPGWFSVALGIMLLVFLQTGTLTLVTLMLTGIVRGGGADESRYENYIREVEVARAGAVPGQ